MQRGADIRRSSPWALAPMAIVALGVLVLALVVSGTLWRSTVGTIVVERVAIGAATRSGGERTTSRFAITVITETSANGTQQRSFTTGSTGRPGFQQTTAGNTLKLYDPLDHTIYVTTMAAQQRALVRQLRATAPAGAQVGVGRMQITDTGTSSSAGFVPGSSSVLEQELRAHQYRIVGRARIGGRPVLKLAQVHATAIPIPHNAGEYASLGTAYVEPGTYYPVEQIVRTTLPGARIAVVERWHGYRVLPATPANRRLLSLVARHPGARIVDNAMAYLHASQSTITFSTHASITSRGG